MTRAGEVLAVAPDYRHEFRAVSPAVYDSPILVNEVQAGAPGSPADRVVWPYPLRDDELADSFTETLKTQTSEAGCVVFPERMGNGFVSARTAGDVADEHLLRLASVLAAEMLCVLGRVRPYYGLNRRSQLRSLGCTWTPTLGRPGPLSGEGGWLTSR